MSERRSLGIYFLKRILQILPQMLFVISFAFVIIRVPGSDPIELMVGPVGATEEYIEWMRAKFGLDKSLPEQYLIYLSQVLRGDLGYSFTNFAPVADVISSRLMNTILLAACSGVFAISLGIVLGVMAARKQHSLTDIFSSGISLVGFATPSFIVGVTLLLIFSLWLGWFPMGGKSSIGRELYGVDVLFDLLRHLVLPTVTLGTGYLALMTRITRNSMLDALGADFILFARSKGLREDTVVIKHALRNALLPVTTAGGYAVARLLTGSVLTETVFGWPGIGRLVYDSLISMDYPVLLALFIWFGLISIFINIVIDIIYVFLDPRIKYR